ncbi:hypothetical protein Peur_064432 [Populus x canadensis]|uniref:Uncharacterized protein n=1 Tax=Populus deltoides TaxID=3696 RepID=A0A8T2WTV3_POPDE|nr:hypothetical protein H0E87_027809 [Populus deltoides]
MPLITPFKVFMEKKKPKGGDSTDDLALVKAAAWAWYQHGSGSEGKPMCESYVTSTRRAPRPSRYKLEDMRLRVKEDTMDGSGAPSPIGADNSLLDNYEVESISKHLDYLMESSSKRSYGVEIFDRDDHLHRGKSVSLLDGDQTCGMKQKKNKSKFFLQGWWLRHSVVCGTREDVVNIQEL